MNKTFRNILTIVASGVIAALGFSSCGSQKKALEEQQRRAEQEAYERAMEERRQQEEAERQRALEAERQEQIRREEQHRLVYGPPPRVFDETLPLTPSNEE